VAYAHVCVNQWAVSSLCLPIGHFVKKLNRASSVQFRYVGLYMPLASFIDTSHLYSSPSIGYISRHSRNQEKLTSRDTIKQSANKLSTTAEALATKLSPWEKNSIRQNVRLSLLLCRRHIFLSCCRRLIFFVNQMQQL